jgi:hypothetical protein
LPITDEYLHFSPLTYSNAPALRTIFAALNAKTNFAIRKYTEFWRTLPRSMAEGPNIYAFGTIRREIAREIANSCWQSKH